AWTGRRVLVAGAAVAGAAVSRALLRHGADVLVADQRNSDRVTQLVAAGARFVGVPDGLPDGVSAVVASPGWKPDHPLFLAAVAAGVEVLGEVEFAWRLRDPAVAWLAVTGTNGKTTTTLMLESILRADGARTVAAGNVGLPLADVVEQPWDVLAVELGSPQLHSAPSLRPLAGTVLNIAPDHLDWHGSLEAYTRAKARVYAGNTAAVVNADDDWSVRLAAGSARLVPFTLGPPPPGGLGLSDGALVEDGADGLVELGRVGDIGVPGAHNVANALAAAALARIYGVAPDAVARGLRAFTPAPHRNALVATVDGVAYVDDSKATNPHAATASLLAYPRVVWIAGGLLKGVPVDEFVAAVGHRLVAVVLLGADRADLARALARHAPDVPVTEVARVDNEAMTEVVARAAGLARPGDTVLLAPAAASWDMFSDYTARGRAFAAAVGALPARSGA
ncbi:MAG: UDP-N-acetylmuramoyl-L-alanine--D-glutamate ligase, partial [Geodermatophilaceae bacterium]|nr:UDP-N-acetylmuramoyl-L-alanine--D-glutamate ligase [Geodermatophilaceae bacterium]